jgi:predicted site-specific integrase-resolvase
MLNKGSLNGQKEVIRTITIHKSVYRLPNKEVPRKTYLYARVSTTKQKKDLDNQITLLKTVQAVPNAFTTSTWQGADRIEGV